MKKAFFLPAPAGVFFVFILSILSGCVSVKEPEAFDIWALLAAGDEKAMGYFTGEIDVNVTDPDGKTPLHYAAERSDVQLASFFVSHGANTNALDNNGQSPLGICIDNSDTAVANILARAGANIHIQIPQGRTAAMIAIGKSPGLFRSLLTPATVSTVDSAGRNVLHLAAISGRYQSVTDVLAVMPASSISINAQDKEGKTALDYALEQRNSRNHVDIAEQLILAGAYSDNPVYSYFAPAVRSANYNIRRNEGLAPIHYAVIGNNTGLISFLLEKKIDLNIKSISGATALHEAVRIGNINIVRTLLENGADVNAVDAKGNTPLHTGIPSHVHREVVTLLLEKGANPNLRDEHGDTPLHIAIILNRSVEVAQALLNGGSDVHIRNIDGKTPLYIAVQEGRSSLIPPIISYGSEIFAADNSSITPFDLSVRSNNNTFNLLVVPQTVNQRDSAGNTMLHAVIRNRGTAEQVGFILDNKSPVDARNRDGDTALHIAVRTNQRETGEFLISRQANIFSVNSAGESPLFLALSAPGGIREWILNPNTIIARDGLGNNILHYAVQWNLNHAIPVIIRYGISVEEPNATGETPLFTAAKTNNTSTIRTLLENNANLNARDSQGNSVLHAAVRWNAVNSVSFVIASGIDVNVHSLNGNTPLHDAVALGMSEIETILISQGANLEIKNVEGNTPFMEAVRGGKLSSIEKLIAGRADTSTRNTRGDTPLHIAVGMERVEIINSLLRSGVSIHSRNTRNRTPFQIALASSVNMIPVLLAGGRVNVSDDFGNSALHIALLEKSSSDTIRTIINQGARVNSVDSNGKNPLRLAVDMELWEQAKIIADAGGDPFIDAVDNKTSAEIAFAKGEPCIRAIFSGRAVNAKDNSGNTILHLAARHGNPSVIGVLLELGANKSIRNISAEIPLDIAVRWNRGDNAEVLR